MATLSELADGGAIFRYDPDLPPPKQPMRLIYLLPRVQHWMEETLPTLFPNWTSEIHPAEQLVTFLDDFCAGEELAVGLSFNHLYHVSDFVWELKTADLRVFGWFSAMDCFIASRINTADHIKKYNLYHGIAGEVVHDSEELDLDQPKTIQGDNPHAVVSNYHYP